MGELAEKEQEIDKIVSKSSPENGLDPQLEPLISHYFLTVKDFRDEVDNEVSSYLSNSILSKVHDSASVAGNTETLITSLKSSLLPDSLTTVLLSKLKETQNLLTAGEYSRAMNAYIQTEELFNRAVETKLSLDEAREQYRLLSSALITLSSSMDTTNQIISTLFEKNRTHLSLTIQALNKDDLTLALKNLSIAEVILNSLEKKIDEQK